MNDIALKLTVALSEAQGLIHSLSPQELAFRPASGKWSKKEILGHLIDSATHNLFRFTEIQFKAKPYHVRRYAQTDLVKANDYQNASIEHLLKFWVTLNEQIIHVINNQTPRTLNYVVVLDKNTSKENFAWLIEDYYVHMKHHLEQIREKVPMPISTTS